MYLNNLSDYVFIMTITKQNPVKTSVKPPDKLSEEHIEAERMRDVLLLVKNLIDHEEVTVKLILDCLYDVGSVNIINQKLRVKPLNRLTKVVARMSKPVFKAIAFQWFKKNCPQLIADWLYTQVAFPTPQELPQNVAVEVVELQPYPVLQTENISQEIRHLRYQVRWLTGVSVAAIAALGVTMIWLNFYSQVPLFSDKKIPLNSYNRQINRIE